MNNILRFNIFRIGILASLSFSFINLSAQKDIKNYVKNSSIPIYSINPDSSNYYDLQEIGDAIGDARIVMLGEQDHGDAPTFLAKTRLIQYLHEKKGFNVLAFEDNFFILNYEWDNLLKENETVINSFLKKHISVTWINCDACQPLFNNYIPSSFRTKTPLQISGFDIHMTVPYLTKILDSIMQSLDLPLVSLPNYNTEIIPLLQNWGWNLSDTILHEKYITYLMEIRMQLIRKLSIQDFWVQVINNLIDEYQQYKGGLIKNQVYLKYMNIRDNRMALNLRWLSQVKYMKEKIIVWAHNYHVSKYAGHYPQKKMNNLNSMGSVFTNDSNLRKQTYIIGFTSYKGTAGRLYSSKKIYNVTKPKRNSFENWIESKYNFAFVNFSKFNENYSNEGINFYMSGSIKGNWYHRNDKAPWNKIYDGVFFIREMYPCKEISGMSKLENGVSKK